MTNYDLAVPISIKKNNSEEIPAVLRIAIVEK